MDYAIPNERNVKTKESAGSIPSRYSHRSEWALSIGPGLEDVQHVRSSSDSTSTEAKLPGSLDHSAESSASLARFAHLFMVNTGQRNGT